MKLKFRKFGVKILIAFALALLVVYPQLTGLGSNEENPKEKEHHTTEHHATTNDAEHHEEEEEFNAGQMIFDHILDAHDWHLIDIGDKHISIPLPIILYDRDEGKLVTFMSGKFHHGHDSYKGFKLVKHGEDKGKIVKVIEGTMEKDENASMPLDFSITKTVAGIFISVIILLWVFLSVAKAYKRRGNQAPKGFQSLIEPLILFIRDDVAKPSIGEKKYRRYMPFLLTVFFFIFFSNLLGLVPFPPGGANVTGNIAITMVLAIFTLVITSFSGNRAYWQHIVNAPGVPWWLKLPIPLMPLVEFVGVLTKPFVLMVRLFANITAGHIVILGFISMIFIFGNMSPGMGYGVSVFSVAFAVFIGVLELLVAFIQAYVFTLLSALYFGMATEEHH